MVANPQAYPHCEQSQLINFPNQCPNGSRVGTATIFGTGAFNGSVEEFSLYLMQTPIGTPALLAFNISGTITQVYARVRTGDDYGATVGAINAPQTIPLAGVRFEVWGVPADHGTGVVRRPFFTLPTSCIGEGGVLGAPVRTDITLTGWQGGSGDGSFLSHDNGGIPIGAAAAARSPTDTGPSRRRFRRGRRPTSPTRRAGST